MIQFTFLPDAPWLVVGGVVIAALLFASYFWARGRSNRWLRAALAVLRWMAIAAVLLCLFDPQWVRAIKHQQKSRIAVLVDTSRSMSIKDVSQPRRAEAQERLAEGKHWLEQKFAPQVPDDVAVQYYTFNRALAPLESIDAARADGEATALADSLESLLNLPGDEPLTGVVLVSDGIENARHDPPSVARNFRRKGIPIHTVTTGTTNDMRDIIVESVQAKPTAPIRAPNRIAVTVRASGYDGQTVPVEIRRRDKVIAAAQRTLANGKVELEFTPDEKGFQIYEVNIPAQPGEWLATNNRRAFAVDVVDPTIRVLYMEGTPQSESSPIPEWKYLKAALESDTNIAVKTLYRQFGAKGNKLDVIDTDPVTGEKIYPVEHPTRGFPRTLAELLKYDVIIHSDIRSSSFTPGQLQNIAKLVEEHGGGFVMIGGNSAFGKGGYHRTILDRIIPVAMEQEKDSVAQPFHLRVPPSVFAHPILSIGATREETEAIWTKKFPVLYGCNMVERAKPAATVLAVSPAIRGAGKGVILAVQSIGKGRSMAFASDTTRTWGRDFETLWGEPINGSAPLVERNCDSRYYRQFWVNAVRWLAAGRTGGDNAVTLELAQTECRPNEPIKAKVTVRGKDQIDINNADVSLSISGGGKSNVVTKIHYDSGSRAYFAELVPATNGTFTIAAVAKLKTEVLGNDLQLLVVDANEDREMSDLRARPDVMAAIAKNSGGKVLDIAGKDAAELASTFRNVPPATTEYRRSPMWDRWWALAGILGLLAIEWTLRRVNGMA